MATQPHARVGMIGFTSITQAVLVYAGSFLWYLVLVGSQGVALATDNLPYDEWLYGTLIASNTLTFVLQTVDALTARQTMWPLIALIWTTQFGSIGLASAAVGRALTADAASRVVVCILMLYAQCLFTASQMSVTVAYLMRRAVGDDASHPPVSSPPQPQSTIQPRVTLPLALHTRGDYRLGGVPRPRR